MQASDELSAILTGHWLSDLANFSSFYYHGTQGVNWIGFYFSDGKKLRLGPFHGRVACTEIAFDRGVCGAAFSQKKIMRVPDVHKFPGHIACDANSRSELVIPFFIDGHLVGVLDIDSPELNRFTAEDEVQFSKALEILSKSLSGLPSSTFFSR